MNDAALGRWPITLELAVAWGDMDALGHVNNTYYLRWFESARILYFERTGLLQRLEPEGLGPILARQTIDYRMPVTYPDTIRVQTTVTRLGRTSLTMGFRIFSSKFGDKLVAEGEGIGVLMNYRTGQKVELDDAFRTAIYSLEASSTV